MRIKPGTLIIEVETMHSDILLEIRRFDVVVTWDNLCEFLCGVVVAMVLYPH